MRYRASASLGAVLLLAQSQSTAGLRGVVPDKEALYTAEQFHCFASGIAIPGNRVNDDVCDCSDGSDEPGTSACHNGYFYCLNVGHRPWWLSSTFVDDGICDCCDGSDERSGCADNCAAIGEAETRQLRDTLAHFEQGAAARGHLLAQAQGLRQQWAQEAAAAAAKVAEMQPSVDALRARKEELQQETDALEKLKNVPGEDASAGGGADGAVDDYEPNEYKDPRDPESWDLDEEDEEHDAYHAAAADEAQDAGAGEEDPDEVGRRIAAQWTSDPAAAGSAGSSDDEQDGDAAGSSKCSAGGDAEACAADAKAQAQGKPAGLLGRLQQTFSGSKGDAKSAGDNAGAEAPASDAGSGDNAEDTGLTAEQQQRLDELSPQLAEAQRKLSQEERTFKQAEREAETARKKQEQDYGPDDVYAYMQDQCFEFKLDKYTYKVCAFGKASQHEDGASTSLGTFSHYDHNYTHFEFTQGQQCWQGPARSMTVALQCGAETQLLSVEEPSRCVYVSRLSTPAMCTFAALQGVQHQLAELTGSWQQAAAPGAHQEEKQKQQQRREQVEEL